MTTTYPTLYAMVQDLDLRERHRRAEEHRRCRLARARVARTAHPRGVSR